MNHFDYARRRVLASDWITTSGYDRRYSRAKEVSVDVGEKMVASDRDGACCR
jgi:hypothetical protein